MLDAEFYQLSYGVNLSWKFRKKFFIVRRGKFPLETLTITHFEHFSLDGVDTLTIKISKQKFFGRVGGSFKLQFANHFIIHQKRSGDVLGLAGYSQSSGPGELTLICRSSWFQHRIFESSFSNSQCCQRKNVDTIHQAAQKTTSYDKDTKFLR